MKQETLNLAVTAGTIVKADSAKVDFLEFQADGYEADAGLYGTLAFLPNGTEMGVFKTSDDSAVGETDIINANVHMWHLGHRWFEAGEGEYFGFKINDDLSGLSEHTATIFWKE